MREGSLACGASKWQTIRRIVLPRAMPGIMTGLILAMARGAGEVAPLMLVGVVKLAPELPVDGVFPFVHLERSFMHLGFHIYDVGFQSRNSEAGKPMVFVTTLLLITLIAAMNITAIFVPRPAEAPLRRQPVLSGHGRGERRMTAPHARSEDERHRLPRSSRRAAAPSLEIEEFCLWYGATQALFEVSIDVQQGLVTALIGPSGCGKSTLLRSLNRMNDLIDGLRIDGPRSASTARTIYGPGVDVIALRKRMGMVFQKPNPFPMSIFENVSTRCASTACATARLLEETVERALHGAGALGRGEGPPQRERARPLGRPAAAPVHRPRDRRRPRGAADGRAVLGPRPDRHRRRSRS